MQAMQMAALGEPESLELKDLPDPTPGPGQVGIDVQAIGCNFADILICRGKYQLKPELPFSPGSEVSGVINALGTDVTNLHVGQLVAAQLGFGAYATRVVADARRVQPVPAAMPAADACALGIAYQTSYLALVDRAHLGPGETLLVHAAAGGVGLAALQIGKALGARVIAGASGAEKLELCKANGADEVVDTREEGWVDTVRKLTGNRGADVIYESVGGTVFEGSLKCIAWAGRLLVIGFSSGDIPALKMNRVLLKHISVIGLNVGAYHENDPQGLRDATVRLFELYAAGKIKPVIHARYPLRDAAKALRELGDRKTVGKLILEP
ncbi:MAG TPA: NADPH:quinone oxidoreductase family protein [Polyangiales bacterium]|nr:NADPH:quinone oxidoreductase family protein [Polyangiales bacterium]